MCGLEAEVEVGCEVDCEVNGVPSSFSFGTFGSSFDFFSCSFSFSSTEDFDTVETLSSLCFQIINLQGGVQKAVAL